MMQFKSLINLMKINAIQIIFSNMIAINEFNLSSFNSNHNISIELHQILISKLNSIKLIHI